MKNIRKKLRLKYAQVLSNQYYKKTYIHPSVNLPEWVEVGNNVIIHENCTIGTEGFGFERNQNGEWLHLPHKGNVIIENNVEIFPGTNIDRATLKSTIIGEGTKIDHHCHIGHNVRIGKNCIITAKVVFGGSAIIGDNVWIGPQSFIMNKIKIGNNVYIGSHTNVIRSVCDSVTIVGNPGRILNKKPPHL